VDKNTECQILSFKVAGQEGESIIDPASQTVTFHMAGADAVQLAQLIPEVEVSEGAVCDPQSGTVVDFSSQSRTYIVTAEDGETWSEWEVTCYTTSNLSDITAFNVEGQIGNSVIDTANHTVTFYMSDRADITALEPTIKVSKKAVISPISGEPQDFTNPVVYQVMSETAIVYGTGSVQEWTVTCELLSSAAEITGFTVDGQEGDTVIDTDNHTVTFRMPPSTTPSALVPVITVSAGASVSPASGETADFTATGGALEYIVTAEDGTVQAWTVICIVNEDSLPPPDDDPII
jgi:hypothetical protein